MHHGVHLYLSWWTARAVAHSRKYFWSCIRRLSNIKGSVLLCRRNWLRASNRTFLLSARSQTLPILGCNLSSHWIYTRPGLPRIHYERMNRKGRERRSLVTPGDILCAHTHRIRYDESSSIAKKPHGPSTSWISTLIGVQCHEISCSSFLSRHLAVSTRRRLAIGHASLIALDRLPLAFRFYTRLSQHWRR